jgi:mgtE-like transporter
VAVAVGIDNGLSLMELVVVSVLGGLTASIVVAATTVLLTLGAVRFEWDLDNLVAPTVSTVGDVVTIPALWAATKVLRGDLVGAIGGPIIVAAAIAIVVLVRRSPLDIMRRIYAESVPVLGGALLLSTFAGLVLEKQLATLAIVPAVLVLQPSFVSSAGAMGSMLAGRVATNLHIGSAEATAVPGPEFRRDAASIGGLALPVMLINVTGAWIVSRALPAGSGPGFGWLLLVGLLAALMTMLFVAAVSYYSTIGAWRIDVDPDSYGTPLVTASVDFVGTTALVLAVSILALA